MKFRLFIDEMRDEEVTVYVHRESALTEQIRSLCENEHEKLEIIGYDGKEIYKTEISCVFCFIAEDNKIYALTADKKLQIKRRLYQLEGVLPRNFIKINQSCIANIEMIEKFDASISGVLTVHFKNGYRDYVSRRNLKNVKERLGL